MDSSLRVLCIKCGKRKTHRNMQREKESVLVLHSSIINELKYCNCSPSPFSKLPPTRIEKKAEHAKHQSSWLPCTRLWVLIQIHWIESTMQIKMEVEKTMKLRHVLSNLCQFRWKLIRIFTKMKSEDIPGHMGRYILKSVHPNIRVL